MPDHDRARHRAVVPERGVVGLLGGSYDVGPQAIPAVPDLDFGDVMPAGGNAMRDAFDREVFGDHHDVQRDVEPVGAAVVSRSSFDA